PDDLENVRVLPPVRLPDRLVPLLVQFDADRIRLLVFDDPFDQFRAGARHVGRADQDDVLLADAEAGDVLLVHRNHPLTRMPSLYNSRGCRRNMRRQAIMRTPSRAAAAPRPQAAATPCPPSAAAGLSPRPSAGASPAGAAQAEQQLPHPSARFLHMPRPDDMFR